MSTRRPKKKDGPYLAAALICDNVIQDKSDNTLSIIKLIDTYNVNLSPDAPLSFPSESERFPVNFTALLAFKTGNDPGEHNLRLIVVSPSGKKSEPYDRPLILSDVPHGGANVIIRQVIAVSTGGLFWVDVYLDEERMTRMPLYVDFKRQSPTEEKPAKQLPPETKVAKKRPAK